MDSAVLKGVVEHHDSVAAHFAQGIGPPLGDERLALGDQRLLGRDGRPGEPPVTLDGKPIGAAFVTHALSHIDATIVEQGGRLTGNCGYPDYQQNGRIACTIRLT